METQNILNQFNENYDEDGRLLSRYGMVEYLTTMRYIEKYLHPGMRILEKHHHPYLSSDHLKMGLIRSGNTELTPMDDDKLTDYIWTIVREMAAHIF